jgi:hypothetical protein
MVAKLLAGPQKIGFEYCNSIRPPLGPTHSPNKWILVVSATKVNRSWRKADSLSPSTGEAELYLHCFRCVVFNWRPPLLSSSQSSWLQYGDVLNFLSGTNWIYMCYAEESRPHLWSSGQSSWLQIQGSRFDSRLYKIFWKVVSLERVHWASWVQLRSYLKEKVAAPV